MRPTLCEMYSEKLPHSTPADCSFVISGTACKGSRNVDPVLRRSPNSSCGDEILTMAAKKAYRALVVRQNI